MRTVSQCPSCGHEVREYRRRLRGSQVRWLIWLVRVSEAQVRDGGDPWVMKAGKRRDAPPSGDDYSRLRLWGLIEKRITDDHDDPSHGAWSPTQLARDFVRRRTQARLFALEVGGNVSGVDGPWVFIDEVLGEPFSYDELVAPHGEAA
jgi:hypothetical protein